MARRIAVQTRSRADYVSNITKLSLEQEEELALYVEGLTGRHLAPTRAMIQNFASEIAKERVSERWVSRFLTRHRSLIPKWTEAMDRVRHAADSGARYKAYFEELHRVMDKYGIEPQHTYNMDEKGFLLGVIGKSKRIFSKIAWERGGVKTNIQDGNREWVTCVATICGDGTHIPSLLIFASKNLSLQLSWVQDIDPTKATEHVTSTLTGWTNDTIGLDWLESIFDRYTKLKAQNSWRLLILDGHGSHLTRAFLAYCMDNRIILFFYPPHSTHTLQPLDVVMFRSLSHHYRLGLSYRVQRSAGLLPVKKMDFYLLFYTAWRASFTKANILKAFEACGVWPKNPEPVLKKFKSSTLEAPRTPVLDRVQRVTEWKHLKELQAQAVSDNSSKAAKDLSASLHYLSTQYELAQLEIEGLRSALQDKKKHSTKQQTLPHPFNPSGSLTMSPSAIGQSLELMAEKERNEVEELAQKARTKAAQHSARMNKQALKLIASQARVKRIDANNKKRAEGKEKVAQRKREREEARLAQPPSNKRKQEEIISSRSSQKKRAVKQLGGGASGVKSGGVGPEATPAPPSKVTRSGRNISLPSKFR
jgi:hypothetical protein